MQLKNYNVYFFFLVLIGGTVLAYFILKPFLVSLLLAAILAHFFNPVYNFFLKFVGKKGIASAITCLVVAIIIIVPLYFVASLCINEVQNFIHNFSQNPESAKQLTDNFSSRLSSSSISKFIDAKKIINEKVIISAINDISQNALVIIGNVYSGVAHLIFVMFIMFFSLFYFFIDGKKLIKKIMRLSPLQDKYENILIEKFNSMTRATVKGTILMAFLQGFLGAILFWSAGVSSPILLGLLMTICSVIPPFGSGLVWLPVGIIMIILGHFSQGIVILLVGALVLSSADNFIRPKLVGGDTQMHPLLILLSTLGGLLLFGISGFIVGPIIMSLFMALWDIYAMEFKNQLEQYNS
jgi:predicted PurR-regulated permease PerM